MGGWNGTDQQCPEGHEHGPHGWAKATDQIGTFRFCMGRGQHSLDERIRRISIETQVEGIGPDDHILIRVPPSTTPEILRRLCDFLDERLGGDRATVIGADDMVVLRGEER